MKTNTELERIRSAGRTSIIIYVLFFFALSIFLLASCGSRKKEKTRLRESVVIEGLKKEIETLKEENNIKTSVEIIENKTTGTVTKTTKTKPVNPNKPATVTGKNGKKTVLENAELEETEITTNEKTETNGKVNTTDQSKKEASKQSEASKKAATKKAASELNLERKSSSWTVIFWLLIPAGLYVFWKFKDKIWWI